MLPAFVAIYLLVSIGIGFIAARKVNNTSDFALAGKSLPLAVVIATTFATWFGSETVLGVPAKFIEGGLGATIEDPWCTSMALVIVGAFLASKLYPMPLLTIGDFYRQRFSRAIELLASITICISYIGWVAAQVTALGLVFSELMGDTMNQTQGMILGTVVVLIYTVLGGMWSVALTDFVQMSLIIVGLVVIAWQAGTLAGGVQPVVELANQKGMFTLTQHDNWQDFFFFLAPCVSLLIGSIPQQDVFQRVMAAKDVKTATRGPIIGGLGYLLFAAVPVFIVLAASIVMKEEGAVIVAEDTQKLLPRFVMSHMPQALQVLFFGALLSAIMSTASATVLAPATVLVQNVIKGLVPKMKDSTELILMRVAVFAVATTVLGYALAMEGTSIYELVASSYEATVVGAFVPLIAGLFWKRATNVGALCSVIGGLATWLFFLLSSTFMADPIGDKFPGVIAGLVVAVVGMIAGSLLGPAPDPDKVAVVPA